MPVHASTYDPEWPRHFERERVLPERTLAPWLSGGVHHIGSTAVPGLAAKYERTHHLHLTEPGSDLWRERLAFRDALRADPVLRDEYQALKQRLAEAHPDDITAYTEDKRAFVAAVLARAGITLAPRPNGPRR